MPYRHEIEACFADAVGAAGLARDAFDGLMAEADRAVASLRASLADGSMPLLQVPSSTADLDAMTTLAERFRAFDDVVVLGTGGSSLGGRTLAKLTDAPEESPRLHFMDNVDPVSFMRLFRALDCTRTGFVAISKSGGTPETIVQFLHCLDAVAEAAPDAQPESHFAAVTEPGMNPLRRLADERDIPVLDHHPEIGGRFSALTVTGLLPALIAGVDGRAVRAGAAEVLAPLANGAGTNGFAPAEGAAVAVGLARFAGAAACVLMPYADRLTPFGRWYRQLWAESLGKDGHGTTPVDALGTVDQHSQLQLYLDGPADKMFTLVFAPTHGDDRALPRDLADDPDLGYLAGRRMGELLDAEQRATAETLIRHGRPTRIITLDRLDAAAAGALMMHFMLETIIAADLLGVEPFDQPAVEEGKTLARSYLAESGPS